MITLIAWGLRILGTLALACISALLMYWRMRRRLDEAMVAAWHHEDVRLAAQRKTHERVINKLARDMADQQKIIDNCKNLRRELDAATCENDFLRRRLARITSGNEWSSKTEHAKA